MLKFLPKAPSSIVNNETYKRFKVDLVHILMPVTLPNSFDDSIELYKFKHNGNEFKPIKRRTEIAFIKSTKCPHCDAYYEYIFDDSSSKKSI